jgi:polyisoprenoid-binding protein YceI
MAFKCYGVYPLALMLVACGASASRPSARPAALPPQNPPSISGARYRVEPRDSELRILVYKAGTMAALGHDHVIVNRALAGWATFDGQASTASFSLTVPTSAFLVDDAGARAEEGADFAEVVTDEAKSGTLRNMLSPALLDAAEFPEITVRSVTVRQAQDALEATVSVTVAGHESTLEVPFTLDRSAGRLDGSGSLTVRQSTLGLTPYSVMLGALRVQDDLRVKFKIVAVAED